MNVKKVAWNGKIMRVEYSTVTDDQKKEVYKFKSESHPHPDFINSLDNMKGHVSRICELTNNYIKPLKVRSVTITDTTINEELVTHIVVVAMREVKGSLTPFIIKTPSGETELHAELEKLVNETKEYIKGKRMQGDLFDKSEKGEEAVAA